MKRIRRLLSKRSGFTLVEIIVAFAVFAIMTTMIVQILNMISQQRRSNFEYANQIDEQEHYLVTHDKLGYNDANSNNGTLSLDFGEDIRLNVDYQMYGTSDSGEVDGLAYFVSKEGKRDENSSGGNDSDDPEDDDNSNTGAQTDRMNARITGTKGFEYISINSVVSYEGKIVTETKSYECELCGYKTTNQRDWHGCEKSGWQKVNLKETVTRTEGDETYYIYAFDLCANAGSNMSKDDIPYANYRLYFYDKSGNPCEIAFANYLNVANVSDVETVKNLSSGAKSVIGTNTGAVSSSPDSTLNKYAVSLASSNGIRVGTPFVSGGIKFEGTNHTRIEIAFKTDPEITKDSFGENCAEQSDGTYQYYANTTLSNNITTGPNIYGAYPKN